MGTEEPKPLEQIPTSSPSKAERDSTIDAINHLIQGKRHLLVQDIPSAVTSLQEACQLLAACYGETANECGEAYFYYGKALLEMAREENSILGNAIGEGQDDDDDEDDDDDDDEEGGDDKPSEESEDSSEGGAKDEDQTVEASKSEDAEQIKPDSKMDSGMNSEASAAAQTTSKDVTPEEGLPGPSTSSGEPSSSTAKKPDEEDDVSTLQLAWEMLELSKMIFSRHSEGNREKQLKLAEVHLYLGEVSMESENYTQAIDDINQCLSIQKELLQPEDRLLAETYYQLGLAHSFSNTFDEGIDYFKTACKVIEDKIAVLLVTAKGTETEKECDIMGSDDPAVMARREIEELKAILPEIQEKITDTEDLKRNAIEAVKAAALNTASLLAEGAKPGGSNSSPDDVSGSSSAVGSSSAIDSSSGIGSSAIEKKPITNISHLVKRKRKPEEELEKENDKKSRTDHPLVETQTSSATSSSSLAVTSSSEDSKVTSCTEKNMANTSEPMDVDSSSSAVSNPNQERSSISLGKTCSTVLADGSDDCVVTSATSATKLKKNSDLNDVKNNITEPCDSVNGDSCEKAVLPNDQTSDATPSTEVVNG